MILILHPDPETCSSNLKQLTNMSLEQKIMAELKTAMLAKDEKSLRSLRAIKAAILLAKTAEGGSGELKEEDEIKLLQKLVKQRKDSLEIFQQQNRTDLAQKEQEEIEVIEKFLPKQLSREELKAELIGNHCRSWRYHHPLIWEK